MSFSSLCSGCANHAWSYTSCVSLLDSFNACTRMARCACIVFFFQAEDGIRDYKVTGVQTCALPICIQHENLNSWVRWVRERPMARGRQERGAPVVGPGPGPGACGTPPQSVQSSPTTRKKVRPPIARLPGQGYVCIRAPESPGA